MTQNHHLIVFELIFFGEKRTTSLRVQTKGGKETRRDNRPAQSLGFGDTCQVEALRGVGRDLIKCLALRFEVGKLGCGKLDLFETGLMEVAPNDH